MESIEKEPIFLSSINLGSSRSKLFQLDESLTLTDNFFGLTIEYAIIHYS
jgi:hypothetical protein